MRPRAVGRTHLGILLVYTLLAVLLTWPTVTHMTTHVPGDGGDDPAIAWNLWWVKQALLTSRTNPLFSDAMFYPLGVNLAFYTLTTLNALTALPVTLTLGVVAASNLHVWFVLVFGAYGIFLLARYLLADSYHPSAWHDSSTWAAVATGGFFAFASSQLFYLSLGQFNIASSHWVPYTILFVFKSRQDLRSIRWPALAALFLTMQAWAEMTYASFLLIFIAVYIAYEIITNPHPLDSNFKFAVRNLILLAFLLTSGISPLLAAMLPDMRAEGDFWVKGTGFAEVFSADLVGFVVPSLRHSLLSGLVGRTGIINFEKGQHIYLGFTLLTLAVVGVLAGTRRDASLPRRGPPALFWLIATILFAWLSLGPTAYVNGVDTRIPGPFVLLQSTPFFKGNRYPGRYSVMLVLCLSVLAAIGIETIWQQMGGRGAASGRQQQATRGHSLLPPTLCCLFCTLYLFEHLSIPLPQSNMTVPEPYTAIAADPGDFSLLDIPVAWRNGFRITGPIDPGFMFGQFYQTVHGRRLLQGNTSRNPEFKFQYFTQAPIINSILALETGHQLPAGRWTADRAVAGDVLRFFGVGYIVVRAGPGTEPGVTPEATLPYIEGVMPVERVYSDLPLTLYRVRLPPLSDRVEVSPTGPLARLYFGEGWGALVDQRSDEADQRIWAQRRRVRLFVPLDGGPQEVTLRLFVPALGQSEQQLALGLNGWQSGPLFLQPGWGEYRLTLPTNAIQAGLNEIHLEFDQLYALASYLDQEGMPGAQTPALLVQSAGEEVGDFGHIYVNGVDVSSNERGYNLAVIATQGDTQTASFDTHLDPSASSALAAFIAALPNGRTVAVAAADEASMMLGSEAVAALRSIGATGDLRGKFRWSHAVIGVKGAEPGSALEVLDGLSPVSVAVGPPVTEPYVAAALGWIRFESRGEISTK